MCLRTDAKATKTFLRRNGHKEKILVYKFVDLNMSAPWETFMSARGLQAPIRNTPYVVGWNKSGARRRLLKGDGNIVHRGIHAYRSRELAVNRAKSTNRTVLVGHVLVKDIFGVAKNCEIVARKIYFSKANYKKAFLTVLKKYNSKFGPYERKGLYAKTIKPSTQMIKELGITDKEIKQCRC